MNKHQNNNWITALLLSFLIYSCNPFNRSLQETVNGNGKGEAKTATEDTAAHILSQETEEEPLPLTILSNDTNALKKAEEDLRNRPELKGKTIQIYQSIHFYADHRIYLKIQNPDNPSYVDEYRYEKGIWGDPQPVIISKNEQVAKSCADLSKVPFTNAYHVFQVLQQKRKEINSTSTDYTPYVAIFHRKIRWYPTSISNDRSKYELNYNEDGTLKSFEQR